MPQPRNEPVPEARVDVPRVRPQGALCRHGSRSRWRSSMCWSSGRAYGPPRRASCPSRSRSLVCKIPIALLGLSETNTIGYYTFGPGSKKEYEQLKKTRASYTDTYALLGFNDEVDPDDGLLVHVRRLADKKKFTLTLSDLQATDEQSKNY